MVTEHGVAATFTQESQRTKQRLLSKCLETQICDSSTYVNIKNIKRGNVCTNRVNVLDMDALVGRFSKRAQLCFLPHLRTFCCSLLVVYKTTVGMLG